VASFASLLGQDSEAIAVTVARRNPTEDDSLNMKAGVVEDWGYGNADANSGCKAACVEHTRETD
jgi:hypothetical protein